jgi:hypothetical protein
MAVINLTYLKVTDKLYNITISGSDSRNQHAVSQFVEAICYMSEGHCSIPG